MAAGSKKVPFSVTIISKGVVPAAQPASEPRVTLSNLDRMMPPVDLGVFICYHKKPAATSSSFELVVDNLRRSLSEVLVPFYVLAGELVHDPADQPAIICNNRGVDFAVARANVEIRELDLYELDKMVGNGLMPANKAGVLAIQVTELECGSVVVSCTFDHRVADAYSAHMFLVSWAETASEKPISTVPLFSRSAVEPRNPLHLDPTIDDMYTTLSEMRFSGRFNSLETDTFTNRLYYVTAADIQRIQDLPTNHATTSSAQQRRTKFESFSANLWKAIARCTNSKRCKLGVVVNGRSRFVVDAGSQATTPQSPSPMRSYFGNVLSLPHGTFPTVELKETSLAHLAEEVHAVVQSGSSEEHFHALVDWLESRRPDGGISRFYCNNGREDGEDEAFVVSSGLRFTFADLDFGWGKPALGIYYFPQGTVDTYVMPIPSPLGKGDWVVYMSGDQRLLEALHGETAGALRPVTAQYLGLGSDDSGPGCRDGSDQI